MDGVDVRAVIGVDRTMLGGMIEENGSVKGSEEEIGDPIFSPADRTRSDENTWAIEGDGKEEMVVEVEGTDVGSENGGGRRCDGSWEILRESLTSTTFVTSTAGDMVLEVGALERDEPPKTNEIFLGVIW
ncbi:hypothetical protein KI387_044432, partial [Taxus chinensis]